MRGNGIVSGGLIPPARRGVVETGLVSIEDWYTTFCGLAGVDPTDERAAAAGLPAISSLDLWPLLSGQNSTSPRTEVVLGIPTISSALSIGDPYLGVQAVIRNDGWKLVIGKTHQNVWTSPMYPNKSTSWNNDGSSCPTGCLYNVFTDPSEYNEVSAQNPEIVAQLRARIAYHNSTMYRPNRGTPSNLACNASLNKWKSFWGPFINY